MFSILRTSSVASARRAFSTSYVSCSFAKVTLVGRLASEPEISNTSTGKEMIRYAIGVYAGIDKPPTWYKFVGFEPNERDKAYLASLPKGTLVFAEGDANLRSYDDEEGKKRVSFEVIHRTIKTICRPKPKEPTEQES